MSKNRISIAIAALGGQGGGVLSNWIVELAEANGYLAQSTAIAGVAQRTGATIYAIELYPEALSEKGRAPVLSLMPVAGDVDICLASELMEAGRAVNRGIVTPEKTTLIASNHRVYAIAEKEKMSDGRLESGAVKEAIQKAAKKLILFDMEQAVLASSSVISSVLFGALAGSGALPFNREAYIETINKSGRAVDTNLAGFELGYQNAISGQEASDTTCQQELIAVNSSINPRIEKLPNEVSPIATYGVHRLVDYQDREYADLYLSRLEEFSEYTSSELQCEIARYLALWMGYEDVIRVADLKTRIERNEKIETEIRAQDGQIWYGHDYFHPRFEEFVDILPSGIGRTCSNSSLVKKLLSPLFSNGRIIRPKTIFGYLLLRSVAKLRFMRKSTFKYKTENKRIIAWLNALGDYSKENPELALEVARCPKILKGYGDTHARGINRFSRIMAFAERDKNNAETAKRVAELRDAALLSETGLEFNKTLESYKLKGLSGHEAQEGEFMWAGSS